MCEMPTISDSEIEVMKIIWKKGSLTASEIVSELSLISNWKPKTIHTLINRLVAKGVLEADKENPKAFLYSSVISGEEYRKYAGRNFLQRMYDGSLDLMLSHFIRDNSLSKEEIDSLRKILDEEEQL